MLRVNSSPSKFSTKSKAASKLTSVLEEQRYKIECYKAWIRAIAPKEAPAIFEEVERRLAEK